MVRILRWMPAVLLLAGCDGSGDRTSVDGSEAAPTTVVAGGGSTVSLHLTLHVDGELVESTVEGDPFTFVQGQGQALPGLEEALEGLSVGDKKSIVLKPEQAFGQYDSTAFRDVAISGFSQPDSLAVGEEVRGQIEGRPFRAEIVAIGDETVTLDMNHPLAGKTLAFQIELVGLR